MQSLTLKWEILGVEHKLPFLQVGPNPRYDLDWIAPQNSTVSTSVELKEIKSASENVAFRP